MVNWPLGLLCPINSLSNQVSVGMKSNGNIKILRKICVCGFFFSPLKRNKSLLISRESGTQTQKSHKSSTD